MGPKHVIIRGSGVRHGESEPVVVDLESLVQIQVILLLLNGVLFSWQLQAILFSW